MITITSTLTCDLCGKVIPQPTNDASYARIEVALDGTVLGRADLDCCRACLPAAIARAKEAAAELLSLQAAAKRWDEHEARIGEDS